jgi:Tfp pilus assembly protein PilV
VSEGEVHVETRQSPPDGFTIIEVLVATTILMTALIGAALLFENAIIVSGNTRNRVVAAHLATEALEKVRGTAADPTKFASLPQGNTPSTRTVNGIRYSISQDIRPVDFTSSTSSCNTPFNSNSVFLVSESVTWPGMAGTKPVTQATTLAPPVGAFTADKGAIAVKVFDSNGAVRSSIRVTVVGGTTNTTIETTSEGCAFFVGLAPGTYTVSVVEGTGVGDQETTTPSQSTSVTVGSTASIQFNYDTAARVDASGWSNGVATPATGIPLSIGNAGLQPYSQYSIAAGQTSFPTVFPYANGYSVFAGNCTDNNPLGKDTNRNLFYPTLVVTPLNVDPGATSSTAVPLYDVPVFVKNGSGTGQSAATVTATATATFPAPNGQYTRVCTSGTGTGTAPTLGLVTTDTAGNSTTAMPLGHWTISAVKGTKSGQTNVWVQPDGTYNVSSSTGLATTKITGPVNVTVS